MRASPAARVLDITRLVSRAGLGPLTGVDRVEAAYLRALSAEPVPLWLLARDRYGWLLLPGAAAADVQGWLAAPETLPQAGWPKRLLRRGDARARLQAGLRTLAVARAPRWRLRALLAKALPAGGTAYNIGLSNLSQRRLGQMKQVPGLRLAVMLHDTVPLDFPEFARQGEPARFATKLAATLTHADVILCNSAATRDDILRHAAGRHCPQLVVAHLGVDLATPDTGALPPLNALPRPYFVSLGTIEPRKNHALLLDTWDEILRRMPPDQVPGLVIAGRRGWRNEAVFARLDTARCMGRQVHELPGLSDGAVAALLHGARALLMPSRAEGFGLPLLEAAARKLPVICAPTAAAREILGDAAVYLDPDDRYSWAAKIIELAQNTGAGNGTDRQGSDGIGIPTWTDHFNLVLKET